MLTLDHLLTHHDNSLHVHSVDVRRLRDDRSPSPAGEEVMFVAVAKVCLMKTDASRAELSPAELGERGDIFEIRDDAELVSPLPVDSEVAVINALQTLYGFKFSFRLNGKDFLYTPHAGDPPWVLRCNTSTAATDRLKLEVAITQRNVRSFERDPLTNLEVDPLRPLNHLLWGLIQDAQNRLTVRRRAHEYEHQYGVNLDGKAIRNVGPADVRSKFIEAFHNLLYVCTVFYEEDDDTTVVADGLPVLNAIKQAHLSLTEGSPNQPGDLPDFWLDRVDAIEKVQGWTESSVSRFRDLGFFGEQLLLSFRFSAWSQGLAADQGGNWARFWRTQVQGYIDGYRAVTGADLTAAPTSSE